MAYVDSKNPKSRPDQAYTAVIEQIEKDGVCPFCPENLRKYHKHPLEEKKYWWVTDNMYPYSPIKHHRIIIHKIHIEHVNEISKEAWDELREIITEETRKLSIGGGTFAMRFGETRFTGGSVSHLHAHITQSNPDDPSYDPKKGLIMRIG